MGGYGRGGSATLDELESQNEEQTGVLIGKVKMLKDVRCSPLPFPYPFHSPNLETRSWLSSFLFPFPRPLQKGVFGTKLIRWG